MRASGACKLCGKTVELSDEDMKVLPGDCPRCPDCGEMLLVVGGGDGIAGLIKNLKRAMKKPEAN
jgi:DNA-directed RNA polymerase subunit RPC12/RpoP